MVSGVNTKLLLVCGLAGVWASGCVVTSVHPYFTESATVFEASALGTWAPEEGDAERWVLERASNNGYRLTAILDGKTNVMSVRLFRLGGDRFFDLFPEQIDTEGFPPPIPAHYLVRVVQLEPEMRLAPLKYEWLENWLEKHPNDLAHHVARQPDQPESPDNRRLVLTADTAALQAFVLRHLKTPEAWKDVIVLKRRKQ
jgi:hypothetical protein